VIDIKTLRELVFKPEDGWKVTAFNDPSEFETRQIGFRIEIPMGENIVIAMDQEPQALKAVAKFMQKQALLQFIKLMTDKLDMLDSVRGEPVDHRDRGINAQR